MKVSFFVCLYCLFAGPSFAMASVLQAHSNSVASTHLAEPAQPILFGQTIHVPDNSVAVLRHSNSVPHGTSDSIVCIGPSKSPSFYTPGKISVTLQRIKPDILTVRVVTYEMDGGRTCFELYMSSDAFNQYTVLIRDTAGKLPLHVFFNGPVSAIPQVSE